MGQFARFICHYEHLKLADVRLQMFVEPIRCENFAEFCRVRKGATNSASNAAKSVLQFLKWAKTETAFAEHLQKILQSEDVLRSKRQRWKKAIEIERSLRSSECFFRRSRPIFLCCHRFSSRRPPLFLTTFLSQARQQPMPSDTSGSR